MLGRPPKPIEVRRAEGNPGKRPLPEVVVGLGKVLEIPAPSGLSEQEQGVWEVIVPDLTRLGWVDQIDTPMLTQYVRALALAERAYDALSHEQLTTRTKKKGKVANPNVRNALQATQAAVRLAEQFGLTPSARARLGLLKAQGLTLAAELENRLGSETFEVPDVIEVEVVE